MFTQNPETETVGLKYRHERREDGIEFWYYRRNGELSHVRCGLCPAGAVYKHTDPDDLDHADACPLGGGS